MDIEELTKSQIVLLTLLVSFMTSIATGITTVALMQQAPPAIVQSVSRVIKETVAQVTPARIMSQPAAVAAPTQVVKTVVVRDSDLISQAVASASRSVVRVYSHDSADPTFLGFGIIIDASGHIVTDIAAVGDNADTNVKRADGSVARAFVTRRDTENGIVYLTEATSTTVTSLGDPATLAGGHVVLGNVIVTLGGSAVSRIQQGVVTSILGAADTGTVPVVETDIPKSGILNGVPFIDTDGNIVGLSTAVSRAVSASGFIPVSAFTSAILHGTMSPVKGTTIPAP